MKFKSVLREAHVPDENPVAHLWFFIFVCKEKVVLSIDGEPLLRQLSAVLAMVSHLKLCARLTSRPGVRKENQSELPIGKLTDFSGPLECRDAIHDDVLTCLAHNDAKIAENLLPCKRPAAPVSRHISGNRKACTSLSLPSGACSFG